MQEEAGIDFLLSQIPKLLANADIPLQTPATQPLEGFGHQTYAPPSTGFSHLLDGTLVQVAGTKHAAGDTLQSTMQVGAYDVTIDAIGVAAVRLDRSGNLEALAAGGLKKIETAKFSVQLGERVDLAL